MAMKIVFNLSLFLITFFTFNNSSLSLTDYQIKKFCEKERKQLNCVKELREKKSNLKKGYPIEIPVIPYRN